MDEVPGKRRGTRKYIYAGYVYHLDTASAENNICRSTRSTSRCTGTARVQGYQVEVVQAHDLAANSHEENTKLREDNMILRLNYLFETDFPCSRFHRYGKLFGKKLTG